MSVHTDVAETRDIDNKIESCKFVYEKVNAWIENADNKVSVSCGVFTGIFGVVTFLTEQHIKNPDNAVINECWRCAYQGSFVFGLLSLLIALYFYTRALIPNLKSIGVQSGKKFPVFFGDIALMEENVYKRLMVGMHKSDFMDELILETWINSKICLKKMQRYRIGVILSLISIGLAFISFASHFMMYR